jgi:hypothetical protein
MIIIMLENLTCIGKHCSILKEQKNIEKLLWVAFYDFIKIFPKI